MCRILFRIITVVIIASAPRTVWAQDVEPSPLALTLLEAREYSPSDPGGSASAAPPVSGARYTYPVLGIPSAIAPGAAEAGRWAFADQLLPVPHAPGNVLMADPQALSTPSFGFGLNTPAAMATPAAVASPNPVLVLRTAVLANLLTTYDTGFQSGSSPSTIALRGSKNGRKSGVFNMTQSSAELSSDVQLESQAVQAYINADLAEDRLEVRQAFGRVGNVLGGKYYTTFWDWLTLPGTILKDSVPAGAVFRPGQVQLQYLLVSESGWCIGAAVEAPDNTDFSLPDADDVALPRWPTLVTRTRYLHPDNWGVSQVAVLVRGIGFEDTDGIEHFTTGWGVSATTRFKVARRDNVRVGFVGGEGLGNYIFGLNAGPNAAFIDDMNRIHRLQNLGTSAGYQHYWNSEVWSNFVYGFAHASVAGDMSNDVTATSHNGWVNLIWRPSWKPGVAIGLEYDYGKRVAERGSGENHRIMFSLQIGTPKAKQTSAGPAAPSAPAQSLPSYTGWRYPAL